MISTKFSIRNATKKDIPALAEVEAECFPPAEAAPLEQFEERVKAYPEGFWLLFEGSKLIGFVDGMASNETVLEDIMFANASLHNPEGAWQMIFGVNTIPAYRRQGCAALLLQTAIEDAKSKNRQGLILTCKEKLLHYYAKFGFVSEGLSCSNHGDAIWYQMKLKF